MPIITPHTSHVGIATGNAGPVAQYRSASAFVTPGRAEGLDALARGVGKLGNAMGEVWAERQRVQNATDLLADKVAYEDALRAFDSDYRATRKGVDARTAEDDYNAFHQEQFGKLQKKWGGNPFQMEAVSRMAEGMRLPSLHKAVMFRDQQEEEHKRSVLAASRAQAVQVFADPASSWQEKTAALSQEEANLRLFAGQRIEEVDGKPQWTGGRDVTAELVALRQGFHTEHVESLIATNQIGQARNYIRDHAREFGGKANNLTMMIEHKLEAAARRNEIAEIRHERLVTQKTADDIYSGIRETFKGLPLEEQQVRAAQIIGDIKDHDVRRMVNVRLHEDMSVEQVRKKAADYQSVQAFGEYVKTNNLLPSQAIAALDNAANMSEEAKDKARIALDKAAQRETPQNLAAFDEVRKQIDRRDIVDETQLEAFAFDNGLTTAQAKAAAKYMSEGGNAGKVKIADVEKIYKRLGNGKSMPDGFYDAVLATLEPGKVPTDEMLVKQISGLVMNGEAVGAGMLWGNKSETYAEAVGAGRADSWLPNVTTEQRKEAKAELIKRNIPATEDAIRRYVKKEILGIVPPKKSRGAR